MRGRNAARPGGGHGAQLRGAPGEKGAERTGGRDLEELLRQPWQDLKTHLPKLGVTADCCQEPAVETSAYSTGGSIWSDWAQKTVLILPV